MFGMSPEMLLELMRDREEREERERRRGLPPTPTVEQLERNLPAWRADTEARIARGEVNGQNLGVNSRSGDGGPVGVDDDPFMAYLMTTFGGPPEDRHKAAMDFREEMARRQRERDAAGIPRGRIEQPFGQMRLIGERNPPSTVGEPRPPGAASTYPTRHGGQHMDTVPPEVRQQMEADQAWRSLYGEWRDEEGGRRTQPGDAPFTDDEWEYLREYGYEPTRSPLVLRKRHPNGTVTHVHAAEVRDDPRWPWKAYGMHGPQGEGEDEPDPFWREGRRDW